MLATKGKLAIFMLLLHLAVFTLLLRSTATRLNDHRPIRKRKLENGQLSARKGDRMTTAGATTDEVAEEIPSSSEVTKVINDYLQGIFGHQGIGGLISSQEQDEGKIGVGNWNNIFRKRDNEPASNGSIEFSDTAEDSGPESSRRIPIPTPEEPFSNTTLHTRVGEVSFSYTAMGFHLEVPTAEEYELLVQSTVSYLVDVFDEYFHTTPGDFVGEFLGIEVSLDFTLFETGITSDRCNIYLDYDYVNFYFLPDSEGIPSEEEGYEMLRNLAASEYITSYVQPLGGVFEFVTEVKLLSQ